MTAPNAMDLKTLAKFFNVTDEFLVSGKTDAASLDKIKITQGRIASYEEDQLRELETFLDFLEAKKS